MPEYKVEQGIIRSPGKFEGEPEWVPGFWERVLDGADDEILFDEDPVSVFILDDADRRTIGAAAEGSVALLLWEDTSGFVRSRLVSQTKLDGLRADSELR